MGFCCSVCIDLNNLVLFRRASYCSFLCRWHLFSFVRVHFRFQNTHTENTCAICCDFCCWNTEFYWKYHPWTFLRCFVRFWSSPLDKSFSGLREEGLKGFGATFCWLFASSTEKQKKTRKTENTAINVNKSVLKKQQQNHCSFNRKAKEWGLEKCDKS